ncbi:MAG: enoyl-CoA hydratase/isomerase family protein [Gammaproteobacteria bacterium]|nr:enoyl-CoA hydratase/isomerase family protein [Gammaproteobacteria bacterium]
MFESLQYQADAGVGVLTLNRPERLNAVNGAMASEIETLARQLRDDATLRALIVTGAGRVFCAGADIAALDTLKSADAAYRFLESLQVAFNAIEALPMPTIAAVHGLAFGGGCELALACDFRILGEEARLGVPEIKLGLLPGAGGTQRLSRLLPAAVARQMIYFGEALDAKSSLQHGLINAVVASGEVMNEARNWATRLASLPPLALRSAKLLVHGAALNGLASGIEAERQAVSYLFQTCDAHEGVRAFLEKRSAEFKGN